MQDLEDKIEAEIRQTQPIIRSTPSLKPIDDYQDIKKEPQADNILIYSLLIFILGFAIALSGMYWWKGNSLFITKDSQAQQVQEFSQVPPVQKQEDFSNEISEMKSQLEKLHEQQQSNRNVINWIGPKFSLMTTLHNNNFRETQKYLREAKFLLPNGEWKIDNLPPNVTFSEESKAWIQQYIK